MGMQRSLKLTALSALALVVTSACASSDSSRYSDVYDYEGGQNCGDACVLTTPTHTQHHGGVDTTVYNQSGHTTSYGGTTYGTGTVECPAGTTAQADGTCMQTSHDYSYSSSTTTSTYSEPTTTTYSSTTTYGGGMANCPAGTTAQADGTCMQTSSSSYSSSTTSTYTGGSVDIYSGSTSSSSGYQSSGNSSDYMPIRK